MNKKELAATPAVPAPAVMIPVAPPAEIIAIETTAIVAAVVSWGNIAIAIGPCVVPRRSPVSGDPRAVGVVITIRPIIPGARIRRPVHDHRRWRIITRRPDADPNRPVRLGEQRTACHQNTR
jgi:hypothetical protein